MRNVIILLILTLTLSSISSAEDWFQVYDLEFQGELTSYHVEDLNNDGLKDVVMFLIREGQDQTKQRCLSFYFQSDEGFSREPSQIFVVSNKIIVLDFGDVRGDMKKEMVYFESDGLYYFELQENGFALLPRKLFETESLFMLPAHRTLKNWDFVADLNDDGVDEIVVPGVTRTDIYFSNSTRNGWLRNEVSLRAEVRVSSLHSQRYSVGSRAEATYSTPYLALEDFDSDGRKDLLGVYNDSLMVFCQNENGYFSGKCQHTIKLNFGEIWRGQKIQRTSIGDKSERTFLRRIKDLNGDGLLDVISVKVSTKRSILSPRSEVRIHFGKRDTSNSGASIFFPSTPDQVIQLGGTQLVFDILDLNHDNRFDFVIPVVTVGLRNIIRMLLTRTVEFQAETYLMREDGLYPDKPDLAPKMMVSFSYRGGTASPVYEIEDFNGDGYLDILSSLEERRLVVFWGKENRIFQSHVGKKYNILLPQNGEMVKAIDLNSDRKCDVIITYNEDNAMHPELKETLRVLIAN